MSVRVVARIRPLLHQEIDKDIIVTNAGGPPAGPFADTDVSMWRAAFETSIAGPLEVRHPRHVESAPGSLAPARTAEP